MTHRYRIPEKFRKIQWSPFGTPRIAVIKVTLLLIPFASFSGDPVSGSSSKNPKAVAYEAPSDSEFHFYIPGFLPWTDATMGVGGIETGVKVGGDELLKNLDMAALAGVEGRKGKIGFILEGLYLNLGATGSTPGPILSTVDVGYKQVIAEATATYRILESDRAWIEFLAGARYYYLASDLGLTVNPSGVASVSNNLSQALVARTRNAVKAELDRNLAGILAGLPSAASNIQGAVETRLGNRAERAVSPIQEEIRDSLVNGLGSNSSGIAREISVSPPVRRLIKNYVEAKLEARIEERRAAASAAVSAARKTVRERAQRKLAKAEKALSGGLQKQINSRLSNRVVSGSKGWVDPFVGLRGKILISDDLYFVARADYGGFGVSSDSIYNLYGAIGKQVKENVTMEIGIRHNGVDYSDGGFGYDAAFTGPFMGTFIRF